MEYVLRYKIPGEFSQISEPIEAETPREAAKGVIQRDHGPIGSLIDQIPNNDILTVHKIVATEEVTINDLNKEQN